MTQLSVSQALTTALGPLVEQRVYARTFVQPSGDLPTWPSIRFAFVSVASDVTICGDGGDESADYRVQIDLVLERSKGEVEFQSLRSQLLAVMQALGSTFVWAGQRDEFDADTKTNRCSLDYLVYQSA